MKISTIHKGRVVLTPMKLLIQLQELSAFCQSCFICCPLYSLLHLLHSLLFFAEILKSKSPTSYYLTHAPSLSFIWLLSGSVLPLYCSFCIPPPPASWMSLSKLPSQLDTNMFMISDSVLIAYNLWEIVTVSDPKAGSLNINFLPSYPFLFSTQKLQSPVLIFSLHSVKAHVTVYVGKG